MSDEFVPALDDILETSEPREVDFNWRPSRWSLRNLETKVHEYLGDDLDVVNKPERIFAVDTVIDGLPLMRFNSFTLMPGQMLPLHFSSPSEMGVFRVLQANNYFFGILNTEFSSSQNAEANDSDKEFGVITQIVSFKVARDRVPFPSVRFLCAALQRFVLVSQRTDHRSIYIGSVRILRDLVPRDPLCLLRPARKKGYLYSKMRLAPDGSLSKDYGIPLKYLESMWTSIPYTALHACSLEKAMDDLTEMSKRWFSPEEANCIPTDPTKLSFWIASKILITDLEKVHLFVMENVLERLQLEYRLAKRLTNICCRDCNADVGSVSDMFSMNKEGPMGIFVNSRGVAHEIVTLRNLRGVFCFGRPASEMTWFKGYQWTILLCSSCTTHLGWKFTAEEENMEPDCFYACTRMAIAASAEGAPAEPVN
ncbi:hypothetical protein M514_01995 [Trichuris suis]|uniref:Protein cereblon n=1 Tax=Trichuris suis TaxID=68888 RepID=A0A085MIR4_9BILA|nr:hypothetical protein M513_01995 [Trichuris suis]KFD69629.1 hypothetical protein M514_01995 [Trichuris suis]KHJ44338.1 hypothetical protein D918_05349 [Trichuris suis]